jgi:hypothetical protein
LKYVFLEAVGYYGIYIFTASFDYSQRILFSLLLILSSLYAAIYLAARAFGDKTSPKNANPHNM